MCVVSRIYDEFHDRWKPPVTPQWIPVVDRPKPSPADIEEFYELIRKAKEQDKAEGNAVCGSEDKKRKVQELADLLGVRIEFPDD